MRSRRQRWELLGHARPRPKGADSRPFLAMRCWHFKRAPLPVT